MPIKHFQLIVPNYDKTGSGGGPPLTYFRGGSAYDDGDQSEPLPDEKWRGDDLIKDLVFKDDWRDPVKPNKAYKRDDGVGDPTLDTATSYRETLTAELISRGGWREHTDGNRISTTRGDCVEVIGGNHKLIVLGRVADDWDPSGLGDAGSGNANVGRTRQEVSSGGHYNESTSTPGEVVSITWSEENEDGTWTTVEQTDHGDVKSIYKGWIEEQYYGPSIDTTVGCGTSSYPIEQAGGSPNGTSADGHSGQMPKITEKTFARSIVTTEEYEEIEDKTKALIITDKTHIAKSQVSKEYAQNKHSSLSIHLLKTEMLMANTHLIKDACSGWRKNISIGAMAMGLTMLGTHDTKKKGIGLSFNFKASATDIEILGKSDALNVGVEMKIRVGPVNSITIGPNTTVNVTTVKTVGVALKNALIEMGNAAAQMNMGAAYMGLRGIGLYN